MTGFYKKGDTGVKRVKEMVTNGFLDAFLLFFFFFKTAIKDFLLIFYNFFKYIFEDKVFIFLYFVKRLWYFVP